MRKNILVLILVLLSLSNFAQIKYWADTVYSKEDFPGYPLTNYVLRQFKVDSHLVKKQRAIASYNPSGTTASLDFEYWGYTGELNNKIRYGWTIFYDTILLNDVTISTRKYGIVDDFIFYQRANDKKNVGSVKIHKYYKNGKKIRQEYAPGEKWADLPYDPDSLFFELPKMLKLGDSILRIKHKYPRPE
jgi:hypothetical protein